MPVPTRTDAVTIERGVPLRTWFGIGGGAERFARPISEAQVLECLRIDSALRVLGDGANLLVDDAGVTELIISFESPAMSRVEIDAKSGRVLALAGANLPKLINETVRQGLRGMQGLAGVPASVGGAVVMNAGGRFGQISDCLRAVSVADRRGAVHRLTRDQVGFGYRTSGLHEMIVLSAEFALTPDDPTKLRQELKDVMAAKACSQPMKERSAGCVFRNPTLAHDLKDIGAKGERVSAGMLIDRAGGKGLRVGGAEVSRTHANFIVGGEGATATHVQELIKQVQSLVRDRFGVELHTEVVIWSSGR